MTKICPKCRYVRKETDTCPEWQCPSCQVAYVKAGDAPYVRPEPGSTARQGQSLADANWWKWLIVALIVLGVAWQSKITRERRIAARNMLSAHSEQANGQPLVVLYGTSWCGYCAAARALFKANGIQFTDLDVETTVEGREGHKNLGGGGVPLITIGSEVMHGYNEAGLRQALAPWMKTD
ncbi:MAG: glutaredoxin family protein [Burkholderiales bacterium]|nr:glutaredoxin family protein [Burkholderiales bacterium]